MKKILYILSVATVLSACSSNDMLSPDMPLQEGNQLELDITAGDFRTDGSTPGSRAIDNGSTTTFEEGDLVGVIAVQGGTVMYNNIPYRYNSSNGGSWSFANGTDSKNTPCYYDPQYSYIVYYPYSSTADGVATIEGLKAQFAPKSDQRSKESYRASDLLVSTPTTATSQTLTAELTHAYTSISLSPEMKYTLLNGNAFSYVSTGVSDVNFTIGSDVCFPFRADDGSFRYILPDATSGTVRWFYTFGGETYGGSHTLSSGLVVNTRYAYKATIEAGSYGLDKAQTGDFYCTYTENSVAKSFLIPGDVASLPNGVNCIGVVFKAGRDSDNPWKDDCTYTLKGTTTPMTTINGYVLALYDANGGSDCTWGSAGTLIGTNTEQNTGFYGYKNTDAIKAFAASNSKTLQTDFPATYYATVDYETREGGKYAAPANSSGWFLPSAGQGQYWLNNRDVLLASVKKATGDSSYSWKSLYWSSSEYDNVPASYAWRAYFDFGSVDLDAKSDARSVRSIFAF